LYYDTVYVGDPPNPSLNRGNFKHKRGNNSNSQDNNVARTIRREDNSPLDESGQDNNPGETIDRKQ
jgi:hypothetical protein